LRQAVEHNGGSAELREGKLVELPCNLVVQNRLGVWTHARQPWRELGVT